MTSFSDAQTSVAQLKDFVQKFVDERDWRQFHTPKNLSMSLAIEAAELMEHFQWLTPQESMACDEQKRFEAGEEMADVLCYLLGLANELDIDLASALENKMVKNREKYPVEKFKGRFGPDDQRTATD